MSADDGRTPTPPEDAPDGREPGDDPTERTRILPEGPSSKDQSFGTRIDDDATLAEEQKGGGRTTAMPRRESVSPTGSPPAGPSSSASRPAARPSITFQPGEVLSDRFRIVQYLAKGGMGEVYEAEDLEVGERVAIKTILPEIASDETVIARFKREIRLARKVSHPNVCRIWDLFHHDEDDGTRVTYLAMELLPGESLADRLKRTGRMDPEEAMPLIRGMAEGLHAAHDAGIVHRDFKSANVMLVTGPDGSERVVITDFGLARSGGPDDRTLTKDGGIVGTPAYMAPEQVEGAKLGPATDIYALGIVLYEMLTGARPFTGDTALSIAVARLQQAPTPPTTVVPDLDKRWSRTILACLARRPEDRPETALDIIGMLSDETVHIPEPKTPRSRTPLWIAGIAVLLLGAVGVGWLMSRYTTPPAPSAEDSPPVVEARDSVAILGLQPTGPPEAVDANRWVGTALTEMLSTEVSASGALRVIPSDTVARMRVELGLAESPELTEEIEAGIRRVLGSDYLIQGSYLVSPDSDALRLDLKIRDTRGGADPAPVAVRGSTSTLSELVTEAGDALRTTLGVAAVRQVEAARLGSLISSVPEAARQYAAGLEALQRFDTLAARDAFQRAVAADEDFALGWRALARTWDELGYDGNASAAAGRAVALADSLPRVEELATRALEERLRNDWPAAAETYGSLFTVFPDSLEYGLALADAQIRAGDPAAAEQTLEQLRELPQPAGSDPRISLVEADRAKATGDAEAHLAAARSAAAQGAEIGARLLEARALLEASAALSRLGRGAEALPLAQQAYEIFSQAGDRSNTARALSHIGEIKYRMKDLAGAIGALTEALEISREIGFDAGVATNLINLGSRKAQARQVEEARRDFEEALQISRSIGRLSTQATALFNLGRLSLLVGDLQTARGYLTQALEVAEATSDVRRQKNALGLLAQIDAVTGKVRTARDRFSRVVELSSTPAERAQSLSSMALYDFFLTSYDRAEAAYREAIEIWSGLEGREGDRASYQIDLASLRMWRGNLDDAAAIAEAAVQTLQGTDDVVTAARGKLVLAQVHAERGDDSTARRLIEEVDAVFADASTAGERVEVDIELAKAEVILGDIDSAIERMRRVQDIVPTMGILPLQLHARLVEGRVAQAAGDRQRARELYESVRDNAGEYLVYSERAQVRLARL